MYMDANTIMNYLEILIKAKFITKEEAINFADTFLRQGKISQSQYDEIIELINNTYK